MSREPVSEADLRTRRTLRSAGDLAPECALRAGCRAEPEPVAFGESDTESDTDAESLANAFTRSIAFALSYADPESYTYALAVALHSKGHSNRRG